MSNEFEPQLPLFDLDALDQNSVAAAHEAQSAEFQRERGLPDHPMAIRRYSLLIQELDTSDAPLEDKAVDFLRTQAIEVACKLQDEPDEVPDEAVAFAARFFGTPDASHEAIIAAYEKFHDYSMALGWAITYNRTIAQAREEIAATRPHFHVDYGLAERKPDPFRSLNTINFDGDDDQEG